ncbi:MAG: taurine dioxygenase [Alphaproteobacteria bacterium]|nr:taurine dioxygenase [Alphaproteobacteria bacterium]
MALQTVSLSGSIGAEIKGVDLTRLDDAGFTDIHRALLDHGVICFRDQNLTPDQQLAFAARWGDIHLHPYLDGLPNRPEIIEIVKEAGERNRFGDHWHTDQIFTSSPAMATMLYAKEVPPVGGDTMFASLSHAYGALSDGMKELACRLRTYNLYDKQAPRSRRMSAKIPDQDKPAEPAVHPLVRVHPETGRRGLYINEMQTTRRFDGMTVDESRPLIEYLLRHATRPEFTCRIRWQVGTLAIWDNRCLMHQALDDYPDYRRVMHRITIKGDPPVGVGQEDIAA